MLKKFKKKSLKTKVAIIAFIVFMILLVGYVLYSTLKPEPPIEYEMSKVEYGTIVDYLDVNGTVESAVSENFVAVEGVTVEEVFVSVGDKVNKGDLLATFNVASASQYLVDAKKAYDEAQKDYNEAKASSDENAKKKVELTTKIDAKKAEISALEKEIEALEKEIQASESTTEMATIPQEQVDAIATQMAQNGASQEEIDAFVESAKQAQVPVASQDNSKSEELMDKNLKLAQLNSELSSLQAENAIIITGEDESMLEALKNVADAKKVSYESVKAIYDKMRGGWYAENDGVVTVVNVKAGEKFVPVVDTDSSSLDLSALLGASGLDAGTNEMLNSLISSAKSVPTGTGITLESYEDMIVNITVGKSDLLKLKVGMEAIVTSLDSEYEAEVVYVGATAVDSSGTLDLNAITSSLMSGTGGANGALVKVKIHNPDEKIVIGFDVDIKIKLQTVENVLKVPVESVVYNNGSYFVFVYNQEEGTATKREIVKGTLDDTSYEVISGLIEGEMVLRSPDPNTVDGTNVAEKTA